VLPELMQTGPKKKKKNKISAITMKIALSISISVGYKLLSSSQNFVRSVITV
jgi:hypothetical protein